MNFVALDVETANASLASICQIGIASFRDGTLQDSWESLVNPEDYFDGMNTAIHGICEDDVRLSPKWNEVYPKLVQLLRDNVVVSHTPFDRTSLARASEKSHLGNIECRWLDSARVVRRAWPRFLRSGYSLANVATEFGITYRAHNALEDARCAGEILLRAISETGLSVEEWLRRAIQPASLPATGGVLREANPDGTLFGEVLVFTGSLSMVRHEAADAASRAGCEVDAGVTHKTTLLVVGDQDIQKLAGHEKSSKHRKTEDLISKGQKIRILGESDFRHIIAQ